MSTRGVFSLKGMEEYLENIAAAGENVDEAAERAVMAGAEVAQRGMQKRVPKDTHNLERHIKIKGPKRDGNFISAEVGVIHDSAYTDADTARYGMANEYGTSSMAAQPYIRPTLQIDQRKIRAAEKETLEKDQIL